jgi:hypothetical protein
MSPRESNNTLKALIFATGKAPGAHSHAGRGLDWLSVSLAGASRGSERGCRGNIPPLRQHCDGLPLGFDRKVALTLLDDGYYDVAFDRRRCPAPVFPANTIPWIGRLARTSGAAARPRPPPADVAAGAS